MLSTKKIIFGIVFLGGIVGGALLVRYQESSVKEGQSVSWVDGVLHERSEPSEALHPLAIETLRAREYPGSDIVIEQTLPAGSNYRRYVASYQSDGLKIYGLLTIPSGEIPEGGFPAIVFNHGYIPPDVYRMTERYVAYVDYFARRRYVVFKIDYRGHGDSEGEALGANYDPGYTIDALNAVATLKRHESVNPGKIGMWGHSMGGHVTMTALVVSPDVKVGVIWAGIIGTYDEFFDQWRNRRRTVGATEDPAVQRIRQGAELIEQYGIPRQESAFWASITPTNYLGDLMAPIQLHHGTADESVAYVFGEDLNRRLSEAGVYVEFYTYEGGDHNLSSPHFTPAMSRSVEFFDRTLKEGF